MPDSIYDIPVRTIDGREVTIGEWRGQVLLIVNVASRCGYTPQYTGLEALYRQYRDDGFAVLGFPCDQFGHQEPGDEAEIGRFCKLTYDVTFPLFSKISVNGPNAHPLYVFLKTMQRGVFGSARIKWNFTKFLVDRDGLPIARFGSTDTPEAIDPKVAGALAAPATPIAGL
jgi:glutathione peroxidase